MVTRNIFLDTANLVGECAIYTLISWVKKSGLCITEKNETQDR